jgi:hypothetical protein
MRNALIALGIVAIIVAIIVGAYAIQWSTAEVRGNVAANEAIKANPQFRIEAYERFFNQCASIQGLEAQLAAQMVELEAKPTEKRRLQIATNITALTGARGEAVAQYNADARKSYTAGQFRSNSLPYELPTLMPEGGTQCTV